MELWNMLHQAQGYEAFLDFLAFGPGSQKKKGTNSGL